LDLPYKWLWDINYVKQHKYKKSTTNPAYYYRKVKPNSSEENLLLLFKNNLDFGNLSIATAYVLSCPVLAQNLSNARQLQKQRIFSNPKLFFQNHWMHSSDSALRSKTIQYYRDIYLSWNWNKDLEISESPILAVVHGTDAKKAWSVASSGFANLALLDEGFYGRGMYFSSSALYTLPYFSIKKDPCILICFIIPGNPYPVIEAPSDKPNLRGSHLTVGYQSHFVTTLRNGLPFRAADFENNEKQYNEFVIDQESQVLPIFLLSIDRKNLATLSRAWEREVPLRDKRTKESGAREFPEDLLKIDDHRELYSPIEEDINFDDKNHQQQVEGDNNIIYQPIN